MPRTGAPPMIGETPTTVLRADRVGDAGHGQDDADADDRV